MTKYSIGIDPGLAGAIGVLDRDGKFLAVHDMPVILNKEGKIKKVKDKKIKLRDRNIISAIALKNILLQYDDCQILLEEVHAHVAQGTIGAFSLGDSFATIRTVVACCNFPIRFVSPKKWKNKYKLSHNKDMSIRKALDLFPNAPLTLKKHADRAEALLIADYLYRYAWD